MAAHQAHEFVANRQAEAGSGLHRGVADLHKRFKDALLVRCVDADAGVAHRKRQQQLTVGTLTALQRQRHAAMLDKLDRVG